MNKKGLLVEPDFFNVKRYLQSGSKTEISDYLYSISQNISGNTTGLLVRNLLVWMNKRKFPLFYFGIIPIVDLVMCLPSIIFGRPIKEVIMIYINQMGSYSSYTSNNFPSIYNEETYQDLIESVEVTIDAEQL